MLRDGGLGEVERVGRRGQRAVLGDRAQGAQAPQVVHKRMLSNYLELCLHLCVVAAKVKPMLIPIHMAAQSTRRLVEGSGPRPRFVRRRHFPAKTAE